ncbi:unnamed protein product [Rhizoctonia solani]|uniref:Uncharacterized protein n=1 Tax=Rhizoctonia solani TaxID=456999 RepID=A0A8H3AHZ9_9AGAM|nr:unnamed protein product [Rhizoctonia solani]
MSIYDQAHAQTADPIPPAYVQDSSISPEGLRRPEAGTSSEKPPSSLPGEQLTIWSPEDPLGTLPPDYALLVHTASSWSGVHSSNINHLVATLERRLKRGKGPNIGGGQKAPPEDSESDGEDIDINQPEISEEELESDEERKDKLQHGYQMGSQNWRSRVHQRLAGLDRKSTPEADSASLPSEESIEPV